MKIIKNILKSYKAWKRRREINKRIKKSGIDKFIYD